jgi:hypothetical protein
MRPDQQEAGVLASLKKLLEIAERVPVGHQDEIDALNRSDDAVAAVAEYIAANDELRGWIDRALLPSYDEKRKPIPESLRKGLERLDAAHARMKGEAK